MSLTEEDKQWIRDLFREELARFFAREDFRGPAATAYERRLARREELLELLRLRGQAVRRELEEDLEYFRRRFGKARHGGSGPETHDLPGPDPSD